MADVPAVMRAFRAKGRSKSAAPPRPAARSCSRTFLEEPHLYKDNDRRASADMAARRRAASFFCALHRGKMPGRSRAAVAKLERCAYTAPDFFSLFGVVMTENIGIIAGGGQFPRLVAQEARAAGLGVVVCGFQGHTDPATAECADVFELLHLGQLSRMIGFFKEHRVSRVCMAGSISKPKALEFRPDWRAAKLLFSLKKKGDDALLRAIMADIEKDGIHVVAAVDLAPGLRAPGGTLTRRAPTDDEWKDIRYGWPIARAMGSFDIGQCLVVREGMVMAVECLEGTDAALMRGAELGGAGCIAIKMVKPGQDERVDLPSVGLSTIRNLVEHHYAVLAIQAGKTLFFDREEALRLADEHGLAVVALPDDFA